jgi:hypothetical protein
VASRRQRRTVFAVQHAATRRAANSRPYRMIMTRPIDHGSVGRSCQSVELSAAYPHGNTDDAVLTGEYAAIPAS